MAEQSFTWKVLSDFENLYPERTHDMLDILKRSNTEGEAKYALQRALFGTDNEGNINNPDDSRALELTKDWPKREEEVKMPTSAYLFNALGIRPDKDRRGNVTKSATAKFVDKYPQNQQHYRDLLSKDAQIGPEYADAILKNAFKQANDFWYQDSLSKARDEAMTSSWSDPYSIYASLLGHSLLRNMYKAGLEGRDPTLADIGSDAAEAALFAVPGGQWAKITQAARLASLGKYGSWAGRALGEATAPFANEAAQYAMHNTDALEETGINPYGDDVFHDQERTSEATFSPERAALGVMTNMGVGMGMYRAGNKAATALSGDLTRGAQSKATREAIEGTTTAEQTIRNANEVAKNVRKFTSKDGFNAWLAGDAKALDKAAMNDATGVLKFKEKAPSLKVPKTIRSTDVNGYIDELLDYNKIVGGERELFKKTLQAHPELATLIKTPNKWTNVKRAYNSAVSNTGAARSELVNKYGSQSDANLFSSFVGFGRTEELAKDHAERELKNRRAVENVKLMENEGLTDTDRKYMKKIIENPYILESSNDTGFRMWLITRGQDLLRGTSYFRPAWEVEE
jgi:hypothetical protein